MGFLLIPAAVLLLAPVFSDAVDNLKLFVIHEGARDAANVQLVRGLATELSGKYNPSDKIVITEVILSSVHDDSYTGVREYCEEHSRSSNPLVLDMTTECRYKHIANAISMPYLPTSQCKNTPADHSHAAAVVRWAQMMLQNLLGLPIYRVTAILFIRSSNSPESLFVENPTADVSTAIIDIDETSWRFSVDRVIALTNIRTFVIVGNQETHDSVMQKICGLDLPRHLDVISIALDPLPATCQSCSNVSFTYFVSQSPGYMATHTDLTAYFTDVLDALLKWWRLKSTLSSADVDRCSELEGKGTKNGTNTSLTDTTVLHDILGFRIERHNCNGSDKGSVQTKFWHPANGTNISRVHEIMAPTALRVLTIEAHPFTFKGASPNGEVKFSGFSVDVIQEISQRMRFNYSISDQADGKFGILLPDGSWSGIIGELIKGTADLAIGPISVTSERAAVVDFTIPIYELAGIEILIKKRDTGSAMFEFITVFSGFTWLTWAGMLVCMGVSLLVLDKFSPFSLRNSLKFPDGQSHHRSFNAKQSMWFVVTSFTMAGPDNFPVSLSSRVLTVGFWFASIILLSTYTASFAANITLSRLHNAPVQSLDELAAQSKIKFSTVHDSSIEEYFSRMAFIEQNFFDIWKDMSYQQPLGLNNEASFAIFASPVRDTFTRIWAEMTEYGFWNSTTDALSRVLEGNTAYFQESPMVQYDLANHCELTTVGAAFSAKPYAIALKKNSPLTKQISEGILQLQQERVMEDLKKKWWPEVSELCPVVVDNIDTINSDGMTLGMVSGTFLIAIFGVVFGIITLVGEVLLHCATIHRKNPKQDQDTVTDTTPTPEEEARKLDTDNLSIIWKYFERTEF